MSARLRRVLGLLAATFLIACQRHSPSSSLPFAVILDAANSRAVAEKSAQQRRAEYPGLIEQVFVWPVSLEDETLFLVTSQGLSSLEEAEKLVQGVQRQAKGSILPQFMDVFAIKASGKAEDRSLSVPASSSGLWELAARLPWTLDATLEGYLLRDGSLLSVEDGMALQPYGKETEFSTALARLGWKGFAQARYHLGGEAGRDSVWVFVGETEPGKAADGALEAVQKLVGAFSAASRAQARPRPAKPGLPSSPVASSKVKVMFPWGEILATEWTQVLADTPAKGKEPRIFEKTWVAALPESAGVIAVAFDDPASAERLLQPWLLGEPRGLQLSPTLKKNLHEIPDLSGWEEALSCMGMGRFERQMDGQRQKTDWGQQVSPLPSLWACYGKGPARWQFNWVFVGEEALAQTVFDEVYISARQEWLQQSVLKTRKKLDYDVGVLLVQVGDVQGWHFHGAQQGALQELYFRKRSGLWLLQALTPAAQGLTQEALLQRALILPIW